MTKMGGTESIGIAGEFCSMVISMYICKKNEFYEKDCYCIDDVLGLPVQCPGK